MGEVGEDKSLQQKKSFRKEWKLSTTGLLSIEVLSFHICDLMSSYLKNDWALHGVFGIPVDGV